MADKPEQFGVGRIQGRMGIAEPDRQRILQAARRFRQAPTVSERLLWQELRGSKLGVKFRRQHPIGPVVADFCCPQLRLTIEIDGSVHDEQQERDAARQRLLEDRGFHVIRLAADEVELDLPSAVARIVDAVRLERTRSPSPEAGEGAGG